MAMRQWSLLGICSRVISVGQEWLKRARVAETKFRTCRMAATSDLPFRNLPWPVQKLVVQQANLVDDLDTIPDDFLKLGDRISCKCLFFRKYLLPCKHILWKQRMFPGTIREADWLHWEFMWSSEGSGFDIYEKMTSTYLQSEIYEEIGAPTELKLDYREQKEIFDAAFYQINDLADDTGASPELRKELVGTLLDVMKHISGEITRLGAKAWAMEQISDQSRRFLTESQGNQLLDNLSSQPTQDLVPIPLGNKRCKREFQIYEDDQEEQELSDDEGDVEEEATDDEWANVED